MAAAFTGLAMLFVSAAIDADGQVLPGPTAEASISDDDLAAAGEANVRLIDLLGAKANTGAATGRQYLIDVGELAPPRPPIPLRVEQLADCIITRESRWNPNAVNRVSGASGLGQFLSSTWKTTPQGRQGLSVFDPAANRAAVIWMIQAGRTAEFVTARGC